ncbi:hypothetical protein, partial [Serratia sp. M24T3]|uniref:hypothetical protein n=1 Tax=Serratia sp. M24T3 TaxID=932213 RepID=UPI00025BA812
MSRVKFSDLEKIYRCVRFEHDGRSGSLTLSDKEMVDLVTNLISDDNAEDSGLSLKNVQPGDLHEGKIIDLFIEKPRTGLGILALNFDALLKNTGCCFEEKNNFHLIEENFHSKSLIIPPSIVKYRTLLSFIKILKEASAYFDKDKGEFVFIDSGRFSLPVKYLSEDIENAQTVFLDKIKSSLEDGMHLEQKLAILGKSVVNLVKNTSPDNRFEYLLANLESLQNSFSDGYNIFVSDFSYEKIRDQLEAAKVEYTGKIHKAITDIQNQILGIPVATVIVATQMKKSTDFGYEFWVNVAVLIGCWIFSLLVGLMVWNQKHTLETLSDEIERQDEKMKKEYKGIASNFQKIFSALTKRIKWQKKILWIV